MTEIECPFCQNVSARSKEALIDENEYAAAFYDKYPLNDGHALVVPKRHESDFFNLSTEEQLAIWKLLNNLQAHFSEKLEPDGFNVGINISESAGQTVDHAHIHLIPRFEGDTANPRGGIRWAIPERAAYWTKDITLVEELRGKFDVPIFAEERFHTSGWSFEGLMTEVSCYLCSEKSLEVWRKPFVDRKGKTSRSWGIACRECGTIGTLNDYTKVNKRIFRAWSKPIRPPFKFNGEWSKEADQYLLNAYQAGIKIKDIEKEWGVKEKENAFGDRLSNKLLFNRDFEILFSKQDFEPIETFKIMLQDLWMTCSGMEPKEITNELTYAISEWTTDRGWPTSLEKSMVVPSEICNSGKTKRHGRVDVWCEEKPGHKGLAIEIDMLDKVISISKLITAGLDGYIPIWVRHTTPVEIDVPEQIHLISLAQNEIVDIESL